MRGGRGGRTAARLPGGPRCSSSGSLWFCHARCFPLWSLLVVLSRFPPDTANKNLVKRMVTLNKTRL